MDDIPFISTNDRWAHLYVDTFDIECSQSPQVIKYTSKHIYIHSTKRCKLNYMYNLEIYAKLFRCKSDQHLGRW